MTSFQIAITAGAVFGGALLDGFGPLGVMTYAGLATAAGAGVVLAFGRRALREGN